MERNASSRTAYTAFEEIKYSQHELKFTGPYKKECIGQGQCNMQFD